MARKTLKIAGLVLVGLAALVLVAVVGALGWRTIRHHQIAQATAIDPDRGIDEELFVRIGGVEQWMRIRGQDRGNPVLLILHGGPGIATSPFPRTAFHSWTRHFTVVQWDQRGAGKTYGRSGPVGPMVTIDRMARDGIEVAEFLRRRLNKPKIVVYGHSWGTVLGVHMVKARPELFHAYVGSGQAVNQGLYKRIAYGELLAEARTRGDRKAVRELEAAGPPPHASTSQAFVQTRWANAYEPGGVSPLGQASLVLFESEASLSDIRDYIGGIASSEDQFREAIKVEDLRSLGPRFEVPVFVFHGAMDRVTPVGPARAYVESIAAPRKAFAPIPGAGHNVILAEGDPLLKLLVEQVRPLAVEAAAVTTPPPPPR